MISAKYVIPQTARWYTKRTSFSLAISFYSKVLFSSSAKKMESTAFNMKENPIKYVDNVIKSSEDKRLYRAFELSNGLKVILVSDPETDKSAGAVDVNIGSMSEPKALPGLAHFCEHMLFLGTEKYPSENEYTKYISEFGGSYNATTGLDNTVFYFDVVPEHLPGALDRFAQFFLCPLFTESASDKEVLAVHSEHQKNIPNDTWRLAQLERHTSKKDHPYNGFGTGNKETLVTIPKEKEINLREELLKFHKKWYSSNIMTLAILGKESLDELEKLVVPLFSDVMNKHVDIPEWTEHPYGPEQLQMRGYVVPVKDFRNLNISFPTPDFHVYHKTGPSHYIAHLIGHEGPGSLLSALKARGWCNRLVGSSRIGAKGFEFFNIAVDLTEEGMDHVDDIITLVFQCINMIKREGPQKWIFQEYQQIFQTAHRFKDKEIPLSYVSSIVRNMHYYPLEETLTGPYFLTEWRPELIELVLDYLKPSNVRIAVVSQKFESITDEVEPYYGTKYKLEKVPESTIKKWENCGYCEELKMPPVNEFIASNYEILPCEEKKSGTPRPSIIQDTPFTRVWFKQDDEFLLPKATLKFEIVSPLAYLDPLNCNMSSLFVYLLSDSLNEYAYAAELAGLQWGVVNNKYGLVLSIDGYNDKQGVLLDKIMERMTTFKVDPKRFEILKENYVRGLKNFDAEQPYQQAVYYLTSLISEQSWTKVELLESLDELTVKKMEEFIPQMLSKVHVECLIHGNVDKEQAMKIVRILEDRLSSNANLRPLLSRQLLRNRGVQLLDGSSFLFELPNQFHKSSCTETYYQCCLQSTASNMLLELLVQVLHEPCYNTLRTKEQLGYAVFSGAMRANGVQGLRVIVQSEKHPSYVDQRIEAFLTQARAIIEDLSDDEFERHREAVAAIRLEKPKNLASLSSRFWSEIFSQQYFFKRAEVEVAYLRTIKKSDLLEFFDDFIKYDARYRQKLSVHILSHVDGGAGTLPQPEADDLSSAADGLSKPPPYVPPKKIEDITKFKSSQGLYPLVQPYLNINPANAKSKL